MKHKKCNLQNRFIIWESTHLKILTKILYFIWETPIFVSKFMDLEEHVILSDRTYLHPNLNNNKNKIMMIKYQQYLQMSNQVYQMLLLLL
jgi:hypothetical protein